MRPYRESRLTRLFLIAFFILVALYALYEVRGQIIGPEISIDATPPLVHDPFIHITGSASRISSITMNGGEINVTESGAFDEPYLLAPGYNRIVLDAKDAYGRTRARVVEIVYQPDAKSVLAATSTAPVASSTPQKTPATTLQPEPPTAPRPAPTPSAAVSGTASATQSGSSSTVPVAPAD